MDIVTALLESTFAFHTCATNNHGLHKGRPVRHGHQTIVQ